MRTERARSAESVLARADLGEELAEHFSFWQFSAIEEKCEYWESGEVIPGPVLDAMIGAATGDNLWNTC